MTRRQYIIACALGLLLTAPSAFAQQVSPSGPTSGGAPSSSPSVAVPPTNPGQGWSQAIQTDRQVIQKDDQTIGQDYSQIHQDDRTIAQDHQLLEHDKISGNTAGAQQERQAINQERYQRFEAERNMREERAQRDLERRNMRREEWARQQFRRDEQGRGHEGYGENRFVDHRGNPQTPNGGPHQQFASSNQGNVSGALGGIRQ